MPAEGIEVKSFMPEIQIRNGSVYLTKECYEKYFGGLGSVILLMKDENILIMPVHNDAAGGLLMKVRNSRGDRVVHASEFLAHHGLDDLDEEIIGRWDSNMSALVLGSS